jgi:hypothetical protein
MDDEQIRPLTPREADEYENARPSWEKYFEQGFSWILIIGNFVLVLLLFTYPYCEEPEYDLWSGTWSECDDSDEDEIFIYFIGFNLTAFLLFIVYFKLNGARWERALKRIRLPEDLRLQEEERKRKVSAQKKRARDKKSSKDRKAFLSSEKERKTAAFNNRIFQSEFRSPSMSKKEFAWNDTGGKCKLCRSYSIAKELGFWWRIHPTLEVVLLCRNCAEKEGLSVEHNEEVVKSRRISEEVRDSVWNRDGGKCVQCGSNENLEFDHIIPFSKGGANTKRNIQLLCESCNRAKSDNIG